ncbi:flippase-like domain-containing protein [candidate division KSB1 bacterium]|nr:flippase-like domain-containing protein [candidate division KSB1 bacterium]
MKLWMKAAFSLALMALLLWKVDLQQILAAFAATNLNLWLAAFVLFLIQQVLVTYCWQILLAAHHSAPPFIKTLEVHCVGSFFGTFLPTSVAMDVIRAYRLGRYLKHRVDAAGSLFDFYVGAYRCHPGQSRAAGGQTLLACARRPGCVHHCGECVVAKKRRRIAANGAAALGLKLACR